MSTSGDMGVDGEAGGVARNAKVLHGLPSLDDDEELVSFPPDTSWTWVATRQLDHLVLPVDGQRSIYVAWPPGSYCDKCSVITRFGYAGPVSGERAHFPSTTLHRVCEACARRALSLAPDELTGHCCVSACSDRLHLEVTTSEDLAGAGLLHAGDSPGARARDVIARHAPVTVGDLGPTATPVTMATLGLRGWRIAEITALKRRWSSDPLHQWAVWIEPIRALPWPAQRDDPWVW